MTDDFDVDDLDEDLDFTPAISVTGAEPTSAKSAPKKVRRGGWRRRLAGIGVLGIALAAMGGAFAVFASSSGAADNSASASDVAAGKQIFNVSCITCHGANLEGVTGRGPSLIGVGSASVDFQVSTGRMPAAGQGPENNRKTAKFTQAQIDQIAAYVQSIGGGPVLPAGNLADGNVSDGGELFRLNCASCHGTTGGGAPLSAGADAPGLHVANADQIYAAMLSGPENMPVFNDNQLTPEQKKDIVSYVKLLQDSKDPGGNGIDRIGPVSEGIVLWVIGIGVLVIAILWIGAKA
jgi:ubiquinol-cytochrome c reductase cytochrome c subunit